MTNTCVIPRALEAGWDGMSDLFRHCSDDLIEKYNGLGDFNGGEPNHGWQGIPTFCCGFHEVNFPNLVDEAARYLRAKPYESQVAIDAARAGYGGTKYWDYLEQSAKEYAERFPDRADYFMHRTLSEALAGNQGD